MPNPIDEQQVARAILRQLQGGQRRNLRQLSTGSGVSRRNVLKVLRALAREGQVQRDRRTRLSDDSLWFESDDVPLAPRGRLFMTHDGCTQVHYVQAVQTGRARRDPLVAALFGPAGGGPAGGSVLADSSLADGSLADGSLAEGA